MKSIFKSKTFWYNLLTGVVVVASALFGYQPDSVVQSNVQSVVQNPVFITAVNLFLRYITTKPVVIGKPQE